MRELRDIYCTPHGMAMLKGQTQNRTLVSEIKFFNDMRVAAAAVSPDI